MPKQYKRSAIPKYQIVSLKPDTKQNITVGKDKAVVFFFHSTDEKDFVFLLQPAITATKWSFNKS